MEVDDHKTKLFEIPPELMELIPGYLNRRDEDIIALNSFLNNRDFKAIKMLGHKLKGNGSSFGFDGISEAGELLMKASDAENISEISRLTAELQFLIEKIKSQMDRN